MVVDWERVKSLHGAFLRIDDISRLLHIPKADFYEVIGRRLTPLNKYSKDPLYPIDIVREQSVLLGLAIPYIRPTLVTDEELKENKEKQAKRFWLRMELYKMYYAWHKEEMEEAFLWVFNAPLDDWENMIKCFREALLKKDKDLKGTLLERSKQLFSFLS